MKQLNAALKRSQLEIRLAALDLWLGQPNEFDRLNDPNKDGRRFAFHVGKVTRGRVVKRDEPCRGFHTLEEVARFTEAEERRAALAATGG